MRQLVLWPLQLVPQKRRQAQRQVYRHWEGLTCIRTNNPWRQVLGEFDRDPEDFQERQYQEFVTFLPFVQRFLYGSSVGRDPWKTASEHPRVPPARHRARPQHLRGRRGHRVRRRAGRSVFLSRRGRRGRRLRDACGQPAARSRAGHAVPFRPRLSAFLGRGRTRGNCLRLVEWLDSSGNALATSDYDAKSKYLRHVGEHRSPASPALEYLLKPLTPPESGRAARELYFRQLEYYRMPFMAYLAFDDPTALTRGDFARLALCTQPGTSTTLPFSEKSLEGFEKDYFDDRYWARAQGGAAGDTRILASGRVLAVIGRQSDPFFSGRNTGLLGQFRHQLFLLFLIVHFHRAALLSMSDQLAVAMNRLVVENTESVRRFKRAIRVAMENFLRFTHRYWYHEISDQDLARSLYTRLAKQLANETLYDEVRHEMLDMSDYLDSDSMRRQANTILRLTVVTIFAMIATIGTGFSA
jgi:hypothetical protein